MFTYTVTDPRNGKTFTKSFGAAKGAVMFDWGYNPQTLKNDLPCLSFFKSVAAAENAASKRNNQDVLIQAL